MIKSNNKVSESKSSDRDTKVFGNKAISQNLCIEHSTDDTFSNNKVSDNKVEKGELIKYSGIPIFFGTTFAQIFGFNWAYAFIFLSIGYVSCMYIYFEVLK